MIFKYKVFRFGALPFDVRMEEVKTTPRRRRSDVSVPITLLLSAASLLLASAIIVYLSSYSSTTSSRTRTPTNASDQLGLLIHTTCNKTLFPSICHSTLSSTTTTGTRTPTTADLAVNTVNHAIKSVRHASIKMQRLPSPHSPATSDCVYMLDQTLHALHTSVRHLSRRRRRFRTLQQVQTLLSSAMTYQDSCLTGLDDEAGHRRRDFEKIFFLNLLTPISRILSNSLAITGQIQSSRTRSKGLRLRRVLIGLGRPTPDVVVSGDGSGDFGSITEAVKAAPSRSRRRFVVWIRAGVYYENVEIPADKMNVVFVGAGMDRTVITGNRNLKDGWTTFNSATMAVAATGFLARDLSILNTSGPQKGQSVALRVNGDMTAFYGCNISGYQDTLYAHSSCQFYRDCVIRGTVDFIFGNAAAVFQNCQILVMKPVRGQRNMVTAQGRDDSNQPTGFTIQNCTITAAEHSGGERSETYLGRPWRRYSRTMVMGSYLGEVVNPRGWHEWSEPRPLDLVELAEYHNRGPGSKTEARVPWARVDVGMDEALGFTVGNLIGGRWLNATAYPVHYGL